jgi:hypothetical protein
MLAKEFSMKRNGLKWGVLASALVLMLVLAGCGSELVVTISGPASVKKGSFGGEQYSLRGSGGFTGDTSFPVAAEWKITSAVASGTTISSSGVLNVASDETAKTITIEGTANDTSEDDWNGLSATKDVEVTD